MDSCEEVSSGFFVAGCDGSELFESIEETLDEVAFGVEGEVGRGRSRADPLRKTMAVATCASREDFSRAYAARGSLTGYYSSLAEIFRSVSNSTRACPQLRIGDSRIVESVIHGEPSFLEAFD